MEQVQSGNGHSPLVNDQFGGSDAASTADPGELWSLASQQIRALRDDWDALLEGFLGLEDPRYYHRFIRIGYDHDMRCILRCDESLSLMSASVKTRFQWDDSPDWELVRFLSTRPILNYINDIYKVFPCQTEYEAELESHFGATYGSAYQRLANKALETHSKVSDQLDNFRARLPERLAKLFEFLSLVDASAPGYAWESDQTNMDSPTVSDGSEEEYPFDAQTEGSEGEVQEAQILVIAYLLQWAFELAALQNRMGLLVANVKKIPGSAERIKEARRDRKASANTAALTDSLAQLLLADEPLDGAHFNSITDASRTLSASLEAVADDLKRATPNDPGPDVGLRNALLALTHELGLMIEFTKKIADWTAQYNAGSS